MQLGSLTTIGACAPRNLFHFVLRNDVWFERLANIPVPVREDADFAGLALAAGYVAACDLSDLGELERELPGLLAGPAPVLVALRVEPEDEALWAPTNPQPEVPDQQFERMGDEARRLMRALV